MKPVLFLLAFSLPLQAGEADVIDATIDCDDNNVCSLTATVKHDDEGWDHYADRWEVLNINGGEISARVLAHPHVDEQPFTRELSRVRIPPGTAEIVIKAHDSVHGYGGEAVTLKLQDE